MSVLSSLEYFAGVVRHRPDLAGLYFRNRWRSALLRLDHRRADGVSRYPRNVTFKLTLACNLRCKMCAFRESGQVAARLSESLPIERWKAVVDDVATFRPYISVTGGEPLLYPGVADLIAYIRSRGLMCTITTNGTMLARHAEKLMECAPDLLMVSIDGPREVHDEIRGGSGVFERACEGVRLVEKLKRERGVRRPWSIVTCAVTEYSYRTIGEMPGIARQLGVDVMNFQHQWVLTRQMVDAHNRLHGDAHPISFEEMGGMSAPEVDAEAVGREVDAVRALGMVSGRQYIGTYPTLDRSEVRRWYGSPHGWIRRAVPPCAWVGVNILPNGDVEACPGMIAGNVTEEPLTRIWNNDAFRGHRMRLMESKGFPICLRCCRFFRED